jgi:hypothetical protein
MSSKKKIRNAEKRRQRTISTLLDASSILRGSYALVHTKCGRENCWCNQEKAGHPHSRITWSEQGQGVTRKVPSEDRDWIQEVTSNYKEFRRLRRELLQLEDQIRTLLDVYESELVSKTRKGRSYLQVKPKNCRKGVRRTAKRKKRRKSGKR